MKTSLCLVAYALFWSLAGSGLLAQVASPASRIDKPAVAEPARMPDFMQTHGRIILSTPAKPLHLGEESALSLTLKGPPPLQLFTSQSSIGAKGLSSQRIESGEAAATLQPHRRRRVDL